MSHDFAKAGAKSAKSKAAKKPAARKSAKKPAPAKRFLPAWLWFLAGVITTIVLQLFYHLAQIDPAQVVDDIVETIEPKLPEPQSVKPEFRFYEELKQREVAVSGDSVADREQADYNYALQAGSFKNPADADQRRAEIILLGLDVFVERKQTAAGEVWHKVIVGPFTSRSNLNKARNQLISNDIKTLKIKRG